VPRTGSAAGDPDGARPSRRDAGGARGGGVARRGAGGAQGDRARQGPVDDEGEPQRGRGVRAVAARESGVAAAAEGDRRSGRRHARGRSVTPEHPNAALTRRVFAAFGKDAKQISAALSRDIVWRVPGNTVMSGEYVGRRAVVEFLRRTGTETDG